MEASEAARREVWERRGRGEVRDRERRSDSACDCRAERDGKVRIVKGEAREGQGGQPVVDGRDVGKNCGVSQKIG